MAEFQVRHVLDIKAALGEGPLWSQERDALYWLDQRRQTLNRFDPISGANRAWHLDARPGSFTLCEGGLLIAANLGFYRFDFAKEVFEFICDAPFDPAIFRFNDGKADRQGRFWVGSILVKFEHHGVPRASYYCYDAGKITAGITGVQTPNGTGFSPDGTIMYRAESMRRAILAHDYAPLTATPSNERVIAEMPEGFGIPDGGTVDEEGGLWFAVPFGETGKIARFTPDGRLDLHFDVPVLAPTMVAFGGPDMATLFITSGRIEDLMDRPHSPLGGDIFAVETGFRGIAEAITKV